MTILSCRDDIEWELEFEGGVWAVGEYQESSEGMATAVSGLFWWEVKDGAEKIGCNPRSECKTKTYGT